MNIGTAIKQARKAKGIGQDELAHRVGRTQSGISKIEKGLRNPEIDIITDISKALNTSLPMLLFMALTDDDIKPEKREAYKAMKPALNSLIKELL